MIPASPTDPATAVSGIPTANDPMVSQTPRLAVVAPFLESLGEPLVDAPVDRGPDPVEERLHELRLMLGRELPLRLERDV